MSELLMFFKNGALFGVMALGFILVLLLALPMIVAVSSIYRVIFTGSAMQHHDIRKGDAHNDADDTNDE